MNKAQWKAQYRQARSVYGFWCEKGKAPKELYSTLTMLDKRNASDVLVHKSVMRQFVFSK